MNFQVEISYLIGIMTYPFLCSPPPSPALVFLFLILLFEEDGGSPIVLGWGLVLGADLSYYVGYRGKTHKSFCSCYEFRDFRAGKPEVSNLKEKGVIIPIK